MTSVPSNNKPAVQKLADGLAERAPFVRVVVEDERYRGNSFGLARLVLLVIAIWPFFTLLSIDTPLPFTTRVVGWVTWVLCFYPSWQYMGTVSGRRPIPFMPLIGMLYAWYFARPLVFNNYNEHWRIRVDPATDYNYPAQLALEGWILLNIGFRLFVRYKPKISSFSGDIFNDNRLLSTAMFMAALGPIVQYVEFQSEFPIALAGFGRLLHDLGYLGIGLLMIRIAEGKASSVTKTWLMLTVGTLLLLQLSTGFVSGLVTTFAVLLLAWWAVRRTVNLTLVIATAFIAFAGLTIKSGTDAFRTTTWQVSASGMSDAAKIGLFGNIVTGRLANDGLTNSLRDGWKSSVKRSANMDLLAYVVKRTPSRVPFWNGASYVSLIGLAIPRFLWPNKPTKSLGQDFGHRYALLDVHDTHTSFNLPFLVEFYANFGEAGVVVGMFLVGIIYGVLMRLGNRPGQGPIVTIAFIVVILPLLNIESDFSLIFGGLLMDGMALYILLRNMQITGDTGSNTPSGAAELFPAQPDSL